jgi:hypothetical protein
MLKDRKTNGVDLTPRNSELSLCFTFYLSISDLSIFTSDLSMTDTTFLQPLDLLSTSCCHRVIGTVIELLQAPIQNRKPAPQTCTFHFATFLRFQQSV